MGLCRSLLAMDRGRARGSNGAEAGPKFTLDDVELDDPGVRSSAYERQGLTAGAGPRSDAVSSWARVHDGCMLVCFS